MARGSLVTQTVPMTGLAPNLTAAPADGDIMDVGRVALWVDNAGVGAITVTVQTVLEIDGLEVEDLVVSVPAGARKLIAPFPSRLFAQLSDAPVGAGRALVDYSGVTSVTRCVIAI